jgi:hypothetical protein
VRLPRLLELLRVLQVLALPYERLFREVVAALLHGEHRPPLPLLGVAELGVGLVAQALLVGDRRRNLLLRLDELAPHVDEDLIQHLFGVFGPRDQIVDVRPEQLRQSIEESHGYRASRYEPISRRWDASATSILS